MYFLKVMLAPAVAFGVGDCMYQFAIKHRSLHKTPKEERLGFTWGHVLQRLDQRSVLETMLLAALIVGPLRNRFREKSKLLFKQTSRGALLQRLWFEQFLYTPFGAGLFLMGKGVLQHCDDSDATPLGLYYHAVYTSTTTLVGSIGYSWLILFPGNLFLLNRCAPKMLGGGRFVLDVCWSTMLGFRHANVENS